MYKIFSIALNKSSISLADKLPFPKVTTSSKEFIARNFNEADAFIFFTPIPIAIRLTAKYLNSKESDPLLIAVDEVNKAVIPLSGEHRNIEIKKLSKPINAISLCKFIAKVLSYKTLLNAKTATTEIISPELINGYVLEGDHKTFLKNLVEGKGVTVTKLNWKQTPLWLKDDSGPLKVVITDSTRNRKNFDLVIRPPSLSLGVGIASYAKEGDLIALVEDALHKNKLARQSIYAIATLDTKIKHRAVQALANYLEVPLVGYSSSELKKIKTPKPSKAVEKFVGTPSVAEASAIKLARTSAKLIVEKTSSKTATIALARRNRPGGELNIVGIGPGSIELRTIQAEAILNKSEVIIGYERYLDFISYSFNNFKKVIGYRLGEERIRVKDAIAHARLGYVTSLISSGDPSVYALAPLVLDSLNITDNFEVRIVPGISAGFSASSLLGAPLGSDFCAISLSDLNIEKEKILERLTSALEAGFILVLYNPRSSKRTKLFSEAINLINKYRGKDTLIGIVKNAYRENQQVWSCKLAELDKSLIDMDTVLIVGSSDSRLKNGYFYSSRYY